MVLRKANAEIRRNNARTEKVTNRKQNGNYFQCKEKAEIVEVNPYVSLIFLIFFIALRRYWVFQLLQSITCPANRSSKEGHKRNKKATDSKIKRWH